MILENLLRPHLADSFWRIESDNVRTGSLQGEGISTGISYEEKAVGTLVASSGASKDKLSEAAKCLAPLLVGDRFQANLKLLEWIDGARNIAPEICNWTGIYWRASVIFGEKGDDLVLGPFFGASTDHIRIPLNRGFCGLALSSGEVVNVADVTADDRHIACSLTTRSELVIPLYDHEGNSVAELDIDSDQKAAFTPELEKKFRDYCAGFADLYTSYFKKSSSF